LLAVEDVVPDSEEVAVEDIVETLDSVEALDSKMALDSVEALDSEMALDSIEAPLVVPDSVDMVADSVEMVPDSVDMVVDSVEMVPDSVESLCACYGTFHAGGVFGEACFQARRRARRCARCGLLHEDYNLQQGGWTTWKSLIVSSICEVWFDATRVSPKQTFFSYQVY
jgi:hypothetical protein